MIQLRDIFENKNVQFLREEFMLDFSSELKSNNITSEYFGLSMVIKKEHVIPLLNTIQKYMFKVVGIKIETLIVVPYYNENELPLNHYVNIQINNCGGGVTLGFYHPATKTIYVSIGVHLKKILPTIFHELTHAYLHQNNIKLIDNYEKPELLTFDFISMAYEMDQEEGLCELVSSLMCFHVFDCDKSPSSAIEYWLGWRLCVQAFIECAKGIIKICPNNDDGIFISQRAFFTLLHSINQSNNLYKFLKYVPPDAYHRMSEIRIDLQ